MERLKLDAVDRAAFIFEKMMQPVIKMVNKAKSFEAVKKGLYKLYPRLKYQDFQKAIAQPCLVASVLGYIDSGSGSESIDFAEEIEIGFDTPFDLALEYAKQKGYALSPYHWQSVSEEQYRHAFTVARVTSMEVLQKIRERTDEALEEGTTLAQYKKDLIPFLRKKVGLPIRVIWLSGWMEIKDFMLIGWRLFTIIIWGLPIVWAVGNNSRMLNNFARMLNTMALMMSRPVIVIGNYSSWFGESMISVVTRLRMGTIADAGCGR